ncbi:hypothetical protein AAFF_G00119320 [Aldrovandia affinis]|uniref:G-protein coupled receptors family 1 profile domain-containing protein n=1 Tax=Aldrovandia affinis TaxID=143900 RepID=A0AAD7RSQ9_9TELE|nr:hypothetical protein AAFF_G00119320 [Aldrovandia affinis]
MNKAPNARQKNKRITLMLVCVSVTYALMWLPELSAWIWARHSDAFRPHVGFVIFAQVFLYVSSTVNPIIFFGMSEDFREGLASVWTSLSHKDPKAPGNDQSPKAGENWTEVGISVINMQDLKTVSSPGNQEALFTDGRILPDVEHFWQERRKTTAGDEHDPIPWESVDKE